MLQIMLIRGMSVGLGCGLVLRSEIVVFGFLICRLQRSGLAFCSTDMSDHVVDSWRVGSALSFRITVFLLGVGKLMVGSPVLLSLCVIFVPSELFPQSY